MVSDAVGQVQITAVPIECAPEASCRNGREAVSGVSARKERGGTSRDPSSHDRPR
jgi:hypothetical protein